MDIVFIRELEIETVIGVYDWEREVRQRVIFDLEMAHDIEQAAATDNVEYALDYSTVAQRLKDFVGGSEFLLVETMAEQCAALVMKEFGVPWLRLRLCKPGAVCGAKDVGIVIERGTHSTSS